MFVESESDVVAELEMNCNLDKTMVSTYPAWRCPHHYSRDGWKASKDMLHPRFDYLVLNSWELLTDVETKVPVFHPLKIGFWGHL